MKLAAALAAVAVSFVAGMFVAATSTAVRAELAARVPAAGPSAGDDDAETAAVARLRSMGVKVG